MHLFCIVIDAYVFDMVQLRYAAVSTSWNKFRLLSTENNYDLLLSVFELRSPENVHEFIKQLMELQSRMLPKLGEPRTQRDGMPIIWTFIFLKELSWEHRYLNILLSFETLILIRYPLYTSDYCSMGCWSIRIVTEEASLRSACPVLNLCFTKLPSIGRVKL